MSAVVASLPFTFTDRHGTQLFAGCALGLRLALEISGQDGRDANIVFCSATEPSYSVIDEIRAAFAGTPVKWFFHHAPPALRGSEAV
jgi:hypothetical protein